MRGIIPLRHLPPGADGNRVRRDCDMGASFFMLFLYSLIISCYLVFKGANLVNF